MAIENLSQDLADLLATKNFEVKYTDGQGQDSAPAEAKTFAFDWIASSGKNYGTVVIVLGDDSDLQMFFGDNLGKTMENPQDKLDWLGSERHLGFLEEISQFATSHGLGTFSPKDINQLKHTMQGMAAIKEGLFEGYYGTRKVSYVGEQTEARLVIKHNRMIGEDDKRYRYVESLFIETVDGERFKLPFVKLSGGRAMLEHVKQGGRPYDIRGQHINEIVSEMAVLSRFNRASQQRVFEGVTQELVETVHHYYLELRESLQHMATGRGYTQYFESWTPADIGDETALVEDLKTMFIEQTLDARIEAALPTLAKIQQRGNAMKEAQIFENWVNGIMEGTWALPDTPEAQAKLNELMSQELIVGPDATNAKEQLYDVIGDDKLFDILADLAEQDPRANCWDDTDVQARLQELGIQLNTTPDAEQQQPVAPAAGQQAPGTAPEQGMAEGEGMLGRSKYDKRYLDKFDPTEVMNISDDPEMKANRTTRQGSLRTSKKDLEFAFGPPGEDDTWVLEFRNGLVATIYPQPNSNFGMDWFIGGNHPDIEDYVLKAYSAAINDLEEGLAEDQLDELSPGTLSNYVNRAVDDVADRSHGTGFQKGARVAFNAVAGGLPKSGRFEKDPKIANRKVGISRAIGRMEENTELNAMLKYAGVPLKESRIHENSEYTYEKVAKILAREHPGMATDKSSNDFYSAVYHELIAIGMTPKAARNLISYDEDFISDVASAYDHYQSNPGLDESNSGMIMPEADPIATVEAMPDLSAPVLEGTCNATMEGEYCPEHGLAECGMYEMGTVAGSMAPVIGEAPQDPINYNAAITGAYYESKSDTALLARIKSLALLR
jgi:hypothetical protein